MVDSRFHTNAGPFTVGEIANRLGLEVSGEDLSRQVFDVSPLDAATIREVSFLDNPRYIEHFRASKAGACVVRQKFADSAPTNMVLLLTEEPYYTYARIASLFYPGTAVVPGISNKASVQDGAVIENSAKIEPGAVIMSGAHIGNNCYIGANTVIGANVVIDDDSYIGSLVSISHAIIGKRCIVHSGVRIGQEGFGFAPCSTGLFKVPQLGRVIIEDDVEIGANTCIDRGSAPDTIIGQGSKIDNLVQIGHNVRTGRHCIIVAQVGISGSTTLGDGVVLGGQAGLAGHLRIGSNARIAAQSGVIQDIPPDSSYGGYPAVPVRDWHRQSIFLKKSIRRE